eukprot:GSChrysophyteH1.ASY1.ANO1.3207.1 assembled CDS
MASRRSSRNGDALQDLSPTRYPLRRRTPIKSEDEGVFDETKSEESPVAQRRNRERSSRDTGQRSSGRSRRGIVPSEDEGDESPGDDDDGEGDGEDTEEDDDDNNSNENDKNQSHNRENPRRSGAHHDAMDEIFKEVRLTRSQRAELLGQSKSESVESENRHGIQRKRRADRSYDSPISSRSSIKDDQQSSYTYSRSGRVRATRSVLNIGAMSGETYDDMDRSGQLSENRKRGRHDQDQDEEEDDDSSGDEEPATREYSFRSRRGITRQILNVDTLDIPNNRQRGYAYRGYGQSSRQQLGSRMPLRPSSHTRRRSSRSHRTRSRHREHFDSSSESSNSDSSARTYKSPRKRRHIDDEDGFGSYERRRLDAEREIDANPVGIDRSVGFASVGGLGSHIRTLKEMVVLPLLYPEVFHQFGTEPPRGVLFTGPPGTGKTLTARALANSVSVGGSERKVSFFMRKGADCLSKWVGEGERQLRLLFEQARRYQPSIIFFDEIDGLAPVRSVKQDQIHASIVSTLLALMDGLDSRGQVVVIGATNRPDAIDPALRRPGRFDRELLFGLPDSQARAEILQIHTRAWNPPIASDLKARLVERTSGYCGADMKALCSESTLVCLRRVYPTIYQSETRLEIDPKRLQPTWGDFEAALQKIVPASRRAVESVGQPLTSNAMPLLRGGLHSVLNPIAELNHNPNYALMEGSLVVDKNNDSSAQQVQEVANAAMYEKLDDSAQRIMGTNTTFRPRVLLCGPAGAGQIEIARAALQVLDAYPCFSFEMGALLSDQRAHSPEQALLLRAQEAVRTAPSTIYFPDVIEWWRVATSPLKAALASALSSVPPDAPVLWVATFDTKIINLPTRVRDARLVMLLARSQALEPAANKDDESFSEGEGEGVVQLRRSSRSSVIASQSSKSAPAPASSPQRKVLSRRDRELNAVHYSGDLSDYPIKDLPFGCTEQDRDIADQRDAYHLREFRNFCRLCLAELVKDKRYQPFCRPVDPEGVPDYYDVVKCPMDLDTIRSKVGDGLCPNINYFLRDLQQIAFNAKEYNPCTLKDARGRQIVSNARAMIDEVEAYAYRFKRNLGYDLFKRCEDVCQRRGIPPPLPKPASNDEMAPTVKQYYADVLELHEEVREELGEDHPTEVKKREAEEEEMEAQRRKAAREAAKQERLRLAMEPRERDNESEGNVASSFKDEGMKFKRVDSATTEGDDFSMYDDDPELYFKRKRRAEAKARREEEMRLAAARATAEAVEANADAPTDSSLSLTEPSNQVPSQDADNETATVTAQANHFAINSKSVDPTNEEPTSSEPAKGEPAAAPVEALPPLTQEAALQLPSMVKLTSSIREANDPQTLLLLDQLLETVVDVAKTLTTVQLIGKMARLSRAARRFERHWDWLQLIQDIKESII